ncbi:ATP-binding protein [Pseudanabaena sp. PCC 6802]|uniref:ATP-binding protein n=1 Tax=Pseudanabaena sp. PCC 6802 TaxID=118173 RepID=UPI00034D84FA|nr:ATP-binding protein [Pseudanabaena sp. PCC 6802]
MGSTLLDALPNYQLDYREKLSDNPEVRWTYRLTLDGKWEPNLFNFYYRVYGRLVSDLTVPFKLDKDAVRLGETHIHEALREALVNTLIHADHLSTRPLWILKQADSFIFSNPGRLRVPIQQLYEGGVTDPRNPNLQKMFQMLGLGEKAGSGFQKILRAWQEQQWLIPLVSEKLDLELTTVFLPMISFIPEDIETELKEVVGSNYSELTELDRIILVLTHEFGEVSNIDIQRYRKEHPRDIGDCLKRLVTNGYLEQSGRGRWTHYKLLSPGITEPSASQLALDYVDNEASSEHNETSSEHNETSSEHSEATSEHNEATSEHSDRELLLAIAAPIRQKKRVTPDQMRSTILQLCTDRFLLLKALAELLNRSPDTLRTHYLNPMLQERSLELKYPEQPSHPQQAYKAILGTQPSHQE